MLPVTMGCADMSGAVPLEMKCPANLLRPHHPLLRENDRACAIRLVGLAAYRAADTGCARLIEPQRLLLRKTHLDICALTPERPGCTVKGSARGSIHGRVL